MEPQGVAEDQLLDDTEDGKRQVFVETYGAQVDQASSTAERQGGAMGLRISWLLRWLREDAAPAAASSDLGFVWAKDLHCGPRGCVIR